MRVIGLGTPAPASEPALPRTMLPEMPAGVEDPVIHFVDEKAPPEAKPSSPSSAQSQSILYPDNSSRLGLKGMRMSIEQSVFGSPDAPGAQSEQQVPEVPVPPPQPPQELVEAASRAFVPPPMADIVLGEEPPPEVRQAPQPSPQRPVAPPVPVRPARPVRPAGPRMVIPDGIRTPRPLPPVPRREPARVPPASPVPAVSRASPASVAPRRRHTFLSWSFIAVILGVAAAVGYAYAAKLGPFASAGPYRADHFSSDLAEGISRLSVASYTLRIGAEVVPRDADAVPYAGPRPSSSLSSVGVLSLPPSSAMSFMQPDFKADLTFTGTVDADSGAGEYADFRSAMVGTLSGGGSSLRAAFDVMRVDGVGYLNVKEVPFMALIEGAFPGAKELLGKWISLGATASSSASFTRFTDPSREKDLAAFLQSAAKAFDAERVFAPAPPEAVDSWKGDAFRYEVAIRFDRLAGAYRRIANDLRASGEESLVALADMLSASASSLDNPELAPLLAYAAENVTLSVDVAEDGVPLSFSFRTRIVPDDAEAALAESQLEFSVDLALASIEAVAAIDAPEGALPLEEAIRIASGLTEDEYRAEMQLQNIRAMGQAIDTFYDVVGRYPDALEELLATGEEAGMPVEGGDGYSFLRERHRDRPFITSIPDDPYGGAYQYALADGGRDFTLRYSIVLPSARPESAPRLSLYVESVNAATGAPSYIPQVSDGENTMTGSMLSLEAKSHR